VPSVNNRVPSTLLVVAADDSDPKPGDFDAEFAGIGPDDVRLVESSADATVSIQVVVQGDDAARLERVAKARGQRPSELVADLLREAERPAA
jgi:hypothetical protein